MPDKEAIEILKSMMEKYPLDNKEKQAVLTAIGILGWTKLIEGRMKSIKKSRDKRMSEQD